MPAEKYLDAKQAATQLGVSTATLYAYVSRGLIRSEPADNNTKSKKYALADVEQLLLQKSENKSRHIMRKVIAGGHEQATITKKAEPRHIKTSISHVIAGRRHIREKTLADLAQSYSIEQAALYCWTNNTENSIATGIFRPQNLKFTPRFVEWAGRLAGLSLKEAIPLLVSIAALDDVAVYDFRPAALSKVSARIVLLMIALTLGEHRDEGSLARNMQVSLAPLEPRAARVLGQALICSIDGGIDMPAYLGRCVASAGGTPYAVIQSALSSWVSSPAIQKGNIITGGVFSQISRFFDELGMFPDAVPQVVAQRLQRGEAIPGFIMPDEAQDDAGIVLLDALLTAWPESAIVRSYIKLTQDVEEMTGGRPAISLSLTILCRVMQVGDDLALGLFLAGRTIGWLGHAIEQYQEAESLLPPADFESS